MSYRGDIRLGDTIDVKFSTVSTTGAPTTLAGTPTIAAYPGNSTTEVTAGITLSVDFDARTGLHNVRVVATSGNGYATATNYDLVITAGTVGGTSVVGYVIGSFSIEARSAVMPATAAQTLAVDANGRVDLSKVLGSAINALIAGRFDANAQVVGDKTAYALSAAGVQAIWDALTSALTTAGSIGKRLADDIDATVSSRSTYAGADTAGTTTLLGRIAAAITITGGKVDVNDKTGYALTSGERTSIADALLDETNGVETSWTLRQVLRIMFSVLGGKLDGAATTTIHTRDQADGKNRMTATVDANGNRTAVTLDAS